MDNQPPSNQEQPKIEGWLLKKMENTGTWKKRYFQIHGSDLFTYEDKSMKKAKLKGLSLKGGTVGEEYHSTRNNCFMLSVGKKSMHLSAESEESLDQWLDYLELLPEMQILEKPGYVPRSTFGKLASDISGGSRRFPKEVTFAGGNWDATINELSQYYSFPDDMIASGSLQRNWESGTGTIGEVSYRFQRLKMWICYANPKMKNGQEYVIKYVEFISRAGQRIESSDTDPNLPDKYYVPIPTVNRWLSDHGLPEIV